MAMHDQFRQYLEAVDVDGVRRLWTHVFPNLPRPPADDKACIVQIHVARTQMVSIDFKFRAYSHRWLVDHGYPSMLPDHMKPHAERIYPRIVEAVGIAVVASGPLLKPVAQRIERAMADAVEEAYADGRREPEFVRARMKEAGDRERKYFAELMSTAARKE